MTLKTIINKLESFIAYEYASNGGLSISKIDSGVTVTATSGGYIYFPIPTSLAVGSLLEFSVDVMGVANIAIDQFTGNTDYTVTGKSTATSFMFNNDEFTRVTASCIVTPGSRFFRVVLGYFGSGSAGTFSARNASLKVDGSDYELPPANILHSQFYGDELAFSRQSKSANATLEVVDGNAFIECATASDTAFFRNRPDYSFTQPKFESDYITVDVNIDAISNGVMLLVDTAPTSASTYIPILKPGLNTLFIPRYKNAEKYTISIGYSSSMSSIRGSASVESIRVYTNVTQASANISAFFAKVSGSWIIDSASERFTRENVIDVSVSGDDLLVTLSRGATTNNTTRPIIMAGTDFVGDGYKYTAKVGSISTSTFKISLYDSSDNKVSVGSVADGVYVSIIGRVGM